MRPLDDPSPTRLDPTRAAHDPHSRRRRPRPGSFGSPPSTRRGPRRRDVVLVWAASVFACSPASSQDDRPRPAIGEVASRSDAGAPRAAHPSITSDDWPTYNHGVRGWRYNPGESTLSPETADDLIEKWRFPATGSDERVGAIHATPAIVNGHTYFGTASFPAMYKVRPDGTLAWVHRLGASATRDATTSDAETKAANQIDVERAVVASALVTDDAVFFGDTAGIFYALDRATGDLRWKVDARKEGFPGHHPINTFMSSAILADGKVIVGGGGYEHPYPLSPDYPCCTGRGFVVAFDPANGDVAWKYDVGEEPQAFDPPVVIEDANGKHVFRFGPSTSSVWSAPSYDSESRTVYFGTDVHNSPRKPTEDDPRLDTRYSSAVIALDVERGREKWVTQINRGDVFNHTMSGYDPNTRRYKDCSIGDTPKIYSIDVDGEPVSVVGAGCKNGGFYVLRARDGELLANTPVFEGEPKLPIEPPPDPRMIALPSPIGGIQTGCATDGTNVFTNGIDFLSLNGKRPGMPEGGRVVCLAGSTASELWRHERPQVRSFFYKGGDPVGAGIALAGGLACFTTTISEKLVVLDAASGKVVKEADVGTVWSGPSISRGRIFVGTGSVLFFKKQLTGALLSFGLPGEDELDRMGRGDE